jgi:tetratricopeptide (TPR) repeat protein
MNRLPRFKHFNFGPVFFLVLLTPALALGQAPSPVQTPTADSYLRQGMELQRAGQYQKAVEVYRQALALDNKLLGAQVNLGIVLMALEKFEEAITAFRAAATLLPNDAHPLVLLGGAYAGARRDFDAIDTFKEALRLDPNMVEADLGLAAIYTKLGRQDDAEAAMLRAVQLRANDPELQFQLGTLYITREAWDPALTALNRVRDLKPDFPGLHSMLALVYGKTDRLPESVVELREAVRIDPQDWVAWYTLGAVLHRQSSNEEALLALQRSVAIKPSPEAYLELGQLYQLRGALDLAIAALKEADRLRPNNRTILGSLASVYIKAARHLEAITPLSQLVALQPNDPDVRFNLANTYLMVGKYDEAIAGMNQALRLRPESEIFQQGLAVATAGKHLAPQLENFRQEVAREPKSAEAHANLANALHDMRQYAEADAEYGTALELSPNDWSVDNERAINYSEWGKKEQALEYYRKAVALNPNHVLYFVIGSTLRDLGRIDDAIAAYQKSLEIKPTFSYALYGLGEIYFKQGNYPMAIATLSRLLQTEPTHLFGLHLLGMAYYLNGDKLAAMQQYNILKNLDAGKAADLLRAISR